MDTRQQYARYVLPVVAKGVEPVVVASARGRTITAVDGTEYLDCFSGISVVNAGHNHPRILEAARQQMEKLVHYRVTKEPATQEATAVRSALRERGILVGIGGVLGNVVRIQPPLSITAEECTRVADETERVLGSLLS